MERFDEELQDIATRAADLMFLAPLLEPTTKFPMHYVCSRGNDNLHVQLSVSGRQRLIGHKILDPEIACRFADMASLRFRKYRKHTKWNFSEAQAIADTKNDEENGGMLACFLLTRLFNRWRNAGTLKEIEATPEKPKSNRRTVESRLVVLEEQLNELRIDAIEKRLDNALLTIASLQDKVFLLESDTPIIIPTFYPAPTITCTDPSISPNIIKTPPTIWNNLK